jgi:hypothetical protein
MPRLSPFVPHARAVLFCRSGSCKPIPLPFVTPPPTLRRWMVAPTMPIGYMLLYWLQADIASYWL